MTICLLSFNFKPAFARVSHKHLHYTLERYGFDDKFVVLIGQLTQQLIHDIRLMDISALHFP